MKNKMKKILLALAAVAVLFAGCTEKEYYIEQNPYRKIVDYLPSTVTMEVPGTLTPDQQYDWITVAQSGNTATFTFRRNTSGGLREADFSISGEKFKAKVFQRAHSLDAAVTPSLASQGLGSAEINVNLSTSNPDDYAGWGIIYGTANDREAGKVVPQSGVPVPGNNLGSITGLAEETDYFVWAYVESTEGDRVYSNPIGLVPPVYVRAGEDLQAAIDGAKEFSEIRVQGGAVFSSIHFYSEAKNKSLSGGWNADFTKQSWDNLTVIDGGGKNRAIYVAGDAADAAIDGYVELSYLEVRNGFCNGGHGGGIRLSGGPLTVHHCWIHHNEGDRGGGLSTCEDNQSSNLTVYNCIITNNVAEGHAGAFSVEDGTSRANPTYATFIGNIIANNRSVKHDGYAGSCYFYQSVNVKFINNTVVNSLNFYEDNDNWWGSFYCRYNTCAVIANNLILRTWCSKKDNVAFVEPTPVYGGGSMVTFNNNIVSGQLSSMGGPQEDNLLLDHNVDTKTLLNNPDTEMVSNENLQNKTAAFAYEKLSDFLGENYMPKGAALGAGTLATLSYNSYDTANLGQVNNADIKALLENIGTDINGNPYIKNGKVDIGALQSK